MDGIESEIMSHQQQDLINDEIQNEIINVKECKPKALLEKVNLKREPTGSVTYKQILKKSESGNDGSTQFNQMTQDGDGTIPVESNYQHTQEIINQFGGDSQPHRLQRNRFKSLDKHNFISLGAGHLQRPQTSKNTTNMHDYRRKSSRQFTYSEYSNAIYETDKGQYSSFLPRIYDILGKCLNE